MNNRDNIGSKSAYISAVIALFVLAVLIFAAAVTGLSQYFALEHSGREQSRLNSMFFDPRNPEVFIRQGEQALVEQDFAAAAENFRRAAELRENDFGVWLVLGFALAQNGDDKAAETAYTRALELAPNYAQPNRLMGLLLLKGGRPEEAFAYLRRGAAADNSFFPELLDLAFKQFPDVPELVEAAVRPSSLTERKSLARFFIDHDIETGLMNDLLLGSEITDQEKHEFISQLISRGKVRHAYDVWKTRSSVAKASDSSGDLIVDGGFEDITGSDEGGFGWIITEKLSNIAVSLETRTPRSGSKSLKIHFKGDSDPSQVVFSQLVPVRSITTYRLSFAVKSEELVSGGLPVLTVEGEHEPRAVSPAVTETGVDWKVITLEFKTKGEEAVTIALKRAPCPLSPCPIFGEMLLDDFSMTAIR